MAFTNLEKCVYSKKCLKQRRQPPYQFLQQSRSHLATKTFRLSFFLKNYFLQPRIRKTGYFKNCLVSEQLSQITEYVQLNKTVYIYTGLTSLSLPSSTRRVVALVPTSQNIDISINKIDLRVVSLIPRYSLCLLRS